MATYESIPPFSRYGQGDAHMAPWQLYKNSGWDTDVAPFSGLQGPIFNVKAFGALASGANDTVAIQAAITAAVAAGGGVVYFPIGTYTCTGSLNILNKGVTLKGANQRTCVLSYTGTGRFINIGSDIHAGNWAGSLYDGIASFTLIEDLRISGPGVAVSGAVGITDWGCGSNNYNRLQFDGWDKAYFGIHADICTWTDIYGTGNNTTWHLASRSDQNTFIDCYPTTCQIGWLIEYAAGVRWFGGQAVFNNAPAVGGAGIADIVFDAPATGTLSGDIRLDLQATAFGLWFESQTGGTAMPRHVWVGRNGTSARVLSGIEFYGPRIQAANTTNFMDVDAGTNITIADAYTAGSMTGNLVSVNNVASVFPAIRIQNPRNNPFANILGGAGSLYNVEVVARRFTMENIAQASSPFTPTGTLGIENIGPLTGAFTVNTPTAQPFHGYTITFLFLQDGTGGRAVTVFAAKGSSFVNTGNVANTSASWTVMWDRSNGAWRQISFSGWAV